MGGIRFLCFALVLAVATAQKYAIPSMLLTNWKDSAITWGGPRDNLNQKDPIRVAGVTSFRLSEDWSTSCLSVDSFALRVNNVVFSDPKQWDGVQYLTSDGEFRLDVDSYSGSTLGFPLSRSIYFPPSEDFYIVEYSISNAGNTAWNVSLLDYIESDHPQSGQGLWGFKDPVSGLLMIDLTKTGQFYFATQPFQEPTQFQVGDISGPTAPLAQFAAGGALGGQTVSATDQVSIGTLTVFELEPGETRKLYFLRTLRKDYNTATAAAKGALGTTGPQWVTATHKSYAAFLLRGKRPSLSGDEAKFYDISLLFMKNSQNPTLGGFMSSFHPAYGYKVWARDGLFLSMIFTAAGYTDEAAMFLRWLGGVDLRSEGTFHTCYDFWTGKVAPFTEPQYDPDGAFPMALLFYYSTTRDASVVRAVADRLHSVEDFYVNNKGHGNLVPADFSIWEESSDPHTGKPIPPQYYGFSQAMGFGGTYSASLLEREVLGDTARANSLAARAEEIRNAALDLLWMQDRSMFARGIWSDTLAADDRADASTAALVWTGLVNDTDSRGGEHLSALRNKLTRDTHGIARYEGDIFFYSSAFNPGGAEVDAEMPAWGVCAMFVAWCENSSERRQRLTWLVERTAYNLQPVGEAVDAVSPKFVFSSCPDIYEWAGVYVWTTLFDQGLAPGPNPHSWTV